MLLQCSSPFPQNILFCNTCVFVFVFYFDFLCAAVYWVVLTAQPKHNHIAGILARPLSLENIFALAQFCNLLTGTSWQQWLIQNIIMEQLSLILLQCKSTQQLQQLQQPHCQFQRLSQLCQLLVLAMSLPVGLGHQE
jgi:hypothetical protein